MVGSNFALKEVLQLTDLCVTVVARRILTQRSQRYAEIAEKTVTPTDTRPSLPRRVSGTLRFN
jgi:hypothetical protein